MSNSRDETPLYSSKYFVSLCHVPPLFLHFGHMSQRYTVPFQESQGQCCAETFIPQRLRKLIQSYLRQCHTGSHPHDFCTYFMFLKDKAFISSLLVVIFILKSSFFLLSIQCSGFTIFYLLPIPCLTWCFQ